MSPKQFHTSNKGSMIPCELYRQAKESRKRKPIKNTQAKNYKNKA